MVAEEPSPLALPRDRDAEALAPQTQDPSSSCAVLTQLVLPSKLEKPRPHPPGPLILLRLVRGPALRCAGFGVWGSRKEQVGQACICTQHPTEGLAEPRLTYTGEKAEVKASEEAGIPQEAGLRQLLG